MADKSSGATKQSTEDNPPRNAGDRTRDSSIDFDDYEDKYDDYDDFAAAGGGKGSGGGSKTEKGGKSGGGSVYSSKHVRARAAARGNSSSKK
mmetsp:Transcript_57611/g.171868  ORF Transcript_57611/g.171868 Transcript_57611/m.171868 type:complete len:92 (+) Transcript_57611:175-450(+)|eukprot:CAMPEP_0113562284 /NCGR_PEP_ID=MMETSP0015_2-20120614/20442_1 /TAXON_ID=2838 /ORGANISM="Odontella" /LENGTH=91 /DNA_ID=CAMNT_0000464165 /DNA_START=171 /DNA_END=446 /DNA_ORIENTATION=+ /assembly_acc=CAM_ASM_000160